MNPEDEEQVETTGETSSPVSAAAAAASPVSGSVSVSGSGSGGANTRNGRPKTPSNFIGRHRLQAAISHFDQQIRFIQDELSELESIGGSSTVCNELISGVESAPDPLLPMTRGPVDVSWERWFGGGSSSRNHRRWI